MLPRRAPSRGSHLRQVSAASLDSNSPISSPPPQEPSAANLRIDSPFSAGPWRQICTLWFHDDKFSKDEVLFNNSAFSDSGISPGDVLEVVDLDSTYELGSRKLNESSAQGDAKTRSKFSSPAQHRCLFVVKPMPQDIKQRNPKLELSINHQVAKTFGFKNLSQVLISHIDRSQCSASHVDISFRDEYLVRADMWRLVTSELVNKTVYKDQKIVFMGTIKATVKNIFIGGKKVLSGYFAPNTIPVFRSEAARYVVFIQMSREMWDFDAEGTGDILFSRVINGFLPELFKRWQNIEARHLVTIVLFTRVEYDLTQENEMKSLNGLSAANHIPSQDFYRVVVNDIASGHWTTILDELKTNFRTFLRDVSIQRFVETVAPNSEKKPLSISGRPTSAIRGNMLEAIHLATSYLSLENIDRDLNRTGHSIVVITPGSGLFEVSYESLAATTDAVTNMGIAIDLVSLSPMPLHSVPLFKYRSPHGNLGASRSRNVRGIEHLEAQPSMSSFSSKSPTASLRDSELSPVARTLSSQDALPAHSKEWHFGIPHWLDISFWNPATYKEGRRITKNDLNAPIPFTVNKRSQTFVPRVRLYEIQMMGIMESEQSNISIPYLSEKDFGFQRVESISSGGYTGVPTPNFAKQAHSTSPSYRAQLSDSLRPEAFLSSFSSAKMLMMNSPAKRQKKSENWMDEYDENVFRSVPKKDHGRKIVKSKKIPEPVSYVSRAHDRSSVRSILSPRDRESPELERSYSTQLSPRNKDPAISLQLPPRPRDQPHIKPAIKSNKAPRISRTISFALRGLGIGPPRAQASTGVNAEHALGRATPAKTSSTASISDRESSPRPSSSALDDSSSTISVELSQGSLTPRKSVETLELPQPLPIAQARPISIKSISKKSVDGSHHDQSNAEAPLPTAVEMIMEAGTHRASQGPFPMKRTGPKRPGPRFEITGSHDMPTSVSPNRTLAPWVRSINPSNTPKAALRDASWFGRWQHAYPRPPRVALVKWKSLKTPAILPLTTEEFPSSKELAANYLQTPYRVFPNDENDSSDTPRTQDEILRDMVALRLSHGFQIVIGSAVAEATGEPSLESLNVFDPKRFAEEDVTVVLSKGNVIHRLSSVAGGEIEVTRFTRLSNVSELEKSGSLIYSHAIRSILAKKYELTQVKLLSSFDEYNWNYADNYIAGHRDHLTDPTRQLRFWRLRFVFIPLHLPPNARRHMQPFNEDNEEEIHLLGISQLTSLWQRNKYVPADDKRFQSTSRAQKDPNPLNILYQTQNPSDLVGAELARLLLTDPGLDNAPTQLLPESELLERSDFGPGSLMTLAHIMQGETGVRLMDRRWHFRLHYSCFIGSEFTTWLVQTFRDIDSRDEAIKFGNELMKLGLFVHVEKRHNFRDGNYFYQIATQYRVSRPESKSGWFPGLSGKSDYSVPPTPSGEVTRELPSGEVSRSESSNETVTSTVNTPSKVKNKMTIMLSKSLKYDLDPRKRSSRPEVIDLHYDRLHNPENCFHIELSWMSATAKLVDDAVNSWASTAERYGLKLVQVPIAEAAGTVKTQTFRKLYRIKLSVEPPPTPSYLSFGATNFSQQGKSDKHFYQKALLRKFDFVLDFEAASAFSPDVEVLYSWGKPDYQYTQYIHRTGCLLAQISDEGDLLLLANRLVSTKSAAGRDAGHHKFDHRANDYHRPRTNTYTYDPMFSPRLSPHVRPTGELSTSSSTININNTVATSSTIPSLTINPPASSPSGISPTLIDSANFYRTPENLKSQIEEFCHDPIRLQQFYAEEHIRASSTRIGPTTVPLPSSSSITNPALEASIPSLELPASVLGHHISPPAQLETQSYIATNRSFLGGSLTGSPMKVAEDAAVAKKEGKGKESHSEDNAFGDGSPN